MLFSVEEEFIDILIVIVRFFCLESIFLKKYFSFILEVIKFLYIINFENLFGVFLEKYRECNYVF